MASLIEQYTNSVSPNFINKVKMGLLGRSILVLQEDPTTANHANRMAFAKLIINDPDKYTARACQILASQGLNATTVDSQLLSTIDVLADLFANNFSG